jgi:hypothetical protein
LLSSEEEQRLQIEDELAPIGSDCFWMKIIGRGRELRWVEIFWMTIVGRGWRIILERNFLDENCWEGVGNYIKEKFYSNGTFWTSRINFDKGKTGYFCVLYM